MRIKRKQTYTHIGKKDKTESAVGVHVPTKKTILQEDQYEATASGMPMRNTTISQLPIEIDIDPLLKDIVFSEDLEQKKLIMRIYKDIYYNDPIGGSSVDLYSTLPFSDINLGGVSNPRAARVFEEAMERLNIDTLMPELSVDLMVTGAFVANLLPNKSKNILTDLIPHQYENCKVDPLPFYSQDPLITVAMPESYKTVLTSDSPRIQKLRDYLGTDVVSQLTEGALELDPTSTIYIPRKSFTNSTGVSFYRRILPIWLMEKNLFRGTLVESARRQRGILHLVLGDGDQWTPTMADMQMAMELFQNADADPLGAVVATRLGIETSEIRCLCGTTDIPTAKGVMKIGSMVKHDITEEPFTVKITLIVKGPKGPVLANEWHYRGVQPVYELELLNGRTIRATGKHKFIVEDFNNGEIKLQALEDLFSADRVSLYDDDLNNSEATGTYDIRSIRFVGEVPTYDLSIAGNEEGAAPLFVANGFMTKNSGGDFWKVTDMWDQTMAMKLRALGISESFLSGEANYSNSDTSLTVFMESLRSYRDMVTTRLFYNKLFPLISAMNGYTVNQKGKFIQTDPLVDKLSMLHNHNVLDDGTRLLVPSVHWSKQLKPEGDQAYLDMLTALTEKGVPVPLRAIAAAGGFNMDSLLADQEDDFAMVRRVGEYQKKIGELKKEYMPKGAGDDDEMAGYASALAKAEMDLNNYKTGGRSSILGQGDGRIKSLAQRNYGEAVEVHGYTHDGKKRYLHNQKRANEVVNRKIAAALTDMVKNKRTPLTETTVSKYVK